MTVSAIKKGEVDVALEKAIFHRLTALSRRTGGEGLRLLIIWEDHSSHGCISNPRETR